MENTWPPYVDQILLPKVRDGDYLQKITVMPAAYACIRRFVRGVGGPCLLYGFGIDCGLLSNLLRRSGDKVIWEVGDTVVPYQKSPWKKAIIRRLEKWILSRSDCMVNISQGMYDRYFAPLDPLAQDKVIVVENRLPQSFRSTGGPTKVKASVPLRLCWNGALAYPNLYERLLEAVAEDGGRRVTLDIWGAGPAADLARRFSDRYSNIQMHGTYREDPAALRAMHEQVDLNIVLADSSNENIQYAMGNRMSQCLVYETPIIAPIGTAMADRAIELGIGMGVDEWNEDWSDLFDRLIENDLVSKWISNLRLIPDEMGYADSRVLVERVRFWVESGILGSTK